MLPDGPGIGLAPSESIVNNIFLHCSNHSAYGKKKDDVAEHTQDSETPLSLELTMKVHMRTGNESSVNMLVDRGLSISYDHLRRLRTALINSINSCSVGANCLGSSRPSHLV